MSQLESDIRTETMGLNPVSYARTAAGDDLPLNEFSASELGPADGNEGDGFKLDFLLVCRDRRDVALPSVRGRGVAVRA